MTRLVVATVLLALFAPGAHATVYTAVRPDQSSLEFRYSQMGVSMEGRFQRFSGTLSFDPARPAAAAVTIEVELASIDTGTPELDAESAGKDWFDTRAFPVARFASSGVKPLGGNRYAVAGKLSIKGRTRDVVIPATFTAQGNTGVFAGEFTLRRGDFSVGAGDWAAHDVVANDVQVRFRLVATGG